MTDNLEQRARELVLVAMSDALRANCTSLTGESYAHGFTGFYPQEGGWAGEVDGEFDLEKLAIAAITALKGQPASSGWEGIARELYEALTEASPRLAHVSKCWSCRPTTEWAEHGSASFENCSCEIKLVDAALDKARHLFPSPPEPAAPELGR